MKPRTLAHATLPAVFLALCLIGVRSIAGSAAVHHQDNQAGEMSARIEQVLNWLPVDTETVIVAQGPLKLSDVAEGRQGLEELLKQSLIGLVGTIRGKEYKARLTGLQIELLVEGSRHFRFPHGLGLMPYEGCRIAIFSEQQREPLAALMNTLTKDAQANEEIAGHSVARFEEKWENDNWTVLVAQPAADVLLAATDRGYLTEVLKRMSAKPAQRALPSTSRSGRTSISQRASGQSAILTSSRTPAIRPRRFPGPIGAIAKRSEWCFPIRPTKKRTHTSATSPAMKSIWIQPQRIGCFPLLQACARKCAAWHTGLWKSSIRSMIRTRPPTSFICYGGVLDMGLLSRSMQAGRDRRQACNRREALLALRFILRCAEA